MKQQNTDHFDNLENLLRQTFDDSIPHNVENKLRSRLKNFQNRLDNYEERKQQASPYTTLSTFFSYFSRSPFGKIAFVFTSLTILFLGACLQQTGVHSSLAKSIKAIQTIALTMGAIRDTKSMTCELQIENQNGQAMKHTLRWIAPNLSRAGFGSENETIHETWWKKGSEITIVNHKAPYTTITPQMMWIASLADPEQIIKTIEGSLQEIERLELEEKNYIRYRNRDTNQTQLTDILIDSSSRLPHQLTLEKLFSETNEKVKLVMQFNWNSHIDPKLMIPSLSKK